MAEYNFNVQDPYAAQAADIARRQKMAEIMQAQALQPIEKFSYNGIEARISPYQGLAKMLQAYMGGRGQAAALEEQKALGEKARSESQSQIKDFMSAMTGTPGTDRPAVLDPQEIAQAQDRGAVTGGVSNTGEYQIPVTAAVAPNRQKALALALQSSSPILQSAGGALLAESIKPQESLFAKPSAKDFTNESVLEFSRTGGKDYSVLKPRDENKPPSGYEMRTVDGKNTLAFIPGGPADPAVIAQSRAPAAQQSDIVKYEFYVKQETDAGRKPLSFNDWELRKVIAGKSTSTNVTYGAPVAAKDAQGNDVFIQPGRGGGAPSVIEGFSPVSEKLKPVPPHINTAIIGNQAFLNKVDRTEALLNKNPDAIGIVKGMTPDPILNRVDPQGVATRAALADIAAAKVHDLSGAAVAVSEFGRLKKFLPQINDSAETAKIKLNGMRAEIQDIMKMTNSIYSESQGYKGIPNLNEQKPVGKIPRYNPATGKFE
jgi:hypothetical protein